LNIQDRQNFFQFTIHYPLSVISYLAFLRPITEAVVQHSSLFSAQAILHPLSNEFLRLNIRTDFQYFRLFFAQLILTLQSFD